LENHVFRSRRILVVDDVQDAAESLAKVLQTMGHDAQYATVALDAMEVARRTRPELVFLDISMPGLDGYQLAQMLRREFGLDGIRLVAMTGWGRQEDRARARAAGFDAHVLKPAEPLVVDSIIKTIFGDP
jgi:CheY-like chemotaxis protein